MRPLIYRTSGLDSRLRGNDEAIHTETCTTSFPQGQKTKIRNLKSRHSRKSGNPERKISRNRFPDKFPCRQT
ncbi:hypothetical protein COH31_06475 [Neisseria meningitidis]|nr:hypothetical protein COH31_06475 [Neisseria meningitidis]